MRYPILSSRDASAVLAAKRTGTVVATEPLVRLRGDGADLAHDVVAALRAALDALRARFPTGIANSQVANAVEAAAARAVHETLMLPPPVIADADFWTWLAMVHFADFVEWRYGSPEAGTNPANYGVGSRGENLLYRLWLRADLVLDESASDRYHLCRRGQIDFYRSHLFRQGYANARGFARALLRFQYPDDDSSLPRLPLSEIRELVKRLRRLRANLFVEILEEDECLRLIKGEASMVAIP